MPTVFANLKMNDKKQYLKLLQTLKRMNVEDREKIVPYLKEDAVHFLCECFHNVLYTDLKLKNKKKLSKNLKTKCSVHRLKTISSKRPLPAKLKALQQEGTGLGLILSAAIPFLMNLFGGGK